MRHTEQLAPVNYTREQALVVESILSTAIRNQEAESALYDADRAAPLPPWQLALAKEARFALRQALSRRAFGQPTRLDEVEDGNERS